MLETESNAKVEKKQKASAKDEESSEESTYTRKRRFRRRVFLLELLVSFTCVFLVV